MKLNNKITGFLAVTLLLFSGVAVYADTTKENTTIKVIEELDESGEEAEVNTNYFNVFTGTVKTIEDFGTEGIKKIFVEDEEGRPAYLVVTKMTYIVNQEALKVGAVVSGYYDANAPMIMIYPPQYSPEVVVVKKADQNVKVDTFDKNLVSSDGQLKLNISADTKIVSQDEQPFKGELGNRNLVVIYGASTKSIPAQTNPSKIVVLNQKEEPIQEEKSPAEDLTPLKDISSMNILVNHKVIEAPSAYMNDKGTVMLPLRAVAKALDLELKWENKVQKVILNQKVSLTIGKAFSVDNQGVTTKLEAAPELSEGVTFVPLSFFKEVLKVSDAQIVESEILVGN